MKCCKAAHVILDFGVNGLATCQTRVVLGRIFPVFYDRVGEMGGLRISSNMPDEFSRLCPASIFLLVRLPAQIGYHAQTLLAVLHGFVPTMSTVSSCTY